VLDTRAASGQLALIARMVAGFAAQSNDPEAVLKYAREQVEACKEYVFLGTLKYLARSGRMSKVGAFFGNAFKVKPVIVHRDNGATKEAVVRSREAGLGYAVERAREHFGQNGNGGTPRILLAYTDEATRVWVEGTAAPALERAVDGAEMLFTPMSTTAGTHMGPGTWAVTFVRA